MIKKLYPCEKCGRMVPMRTHGMCPYCWKKNSPPKAVKQFKRNINSKNVQDNEILNRFFAFHMEVLQKYPISMASGERIMNPSKCNICHIFPKRYYKSIAADLNNCIYLTWEEHAKFDYLLDCMDFDKIKEEFPNTWEIIRRKFVLLKPNIKETEGKLFQKMKEEFKT